MDNSRFIIQVTKGLIRYQRSRRLIMFYSVLIALLMLFVGVAFSLPDPHDHPYLFLGYWGVCAWITFLAVLLALYDMAKVRADGQRMRRELAQKHLEKKPDDENPS